MCMAPKAPSPPQSPEQQVTSAQQRLTKIEGKMEGAGPKKQAKLSAKAEQQRGILSSAQKQVDANKPPEPPLPPPVSTADVSARPTQVVGARSQRAAKRRATAGPSRLRIPVSGSPVGLSGTPNTGKTTGINLNIGK